MNISSFYISKNSKLKKNISFICILTILAYFLVFSKSNFEIMSNIVTMFFKILLPSLFPFILFGNIITTSEYFELFNLSKINMLTQKFFRISPYAASAIIFGFLFGYPSGARYINDLYLDKKITYEEGDFLLHFINNSSPTFILSSIGVGMFGNIKIGIVLLISHILASFMIGIIYRHKYKFKKNPKSNNTQCNLKLSFNVLYSSILKSLTTMGIIFGFMAISVLLCNYIIRIVNYIIPINIYMSSILLVTIEISSGLNNLIQLDTNLKLSLILISFFLGFSSFSIIFQIFSTVYASQFKLRSILEGKIMHGILSLLITYVLISISKVYEYINIEKQVNLNIGTSFKQISFTKLSLVLQFCIFILYVIFFFAYIKKRLRSKT